MSQTPEDRIRRQYKALKGLYYREDGGSVAALWMRLARQWERPIEEIKSIVHEHEDAATGERVVESEVSGK